jgi:hypothetical protein
MQGLLDGGLLRVLLQIHDLLEVDLRVRRLLRTLVMRLLFVVAGRVLAILTVVTPDGEDRMRPGTLLVPTGIGMV